MDLKIRDDDVRKAENEMVEQFCDRYTSTMIRKSPEEIIHMWLDWQYQRFKFKEEEDFFSIADFENNCIIAVIFKQFASAKRLAYETCEVLNNMYDPDGEETIEKLIQSLRKVKE